MLADLMDRVRDAGNALSRVSPVPIAARFGVFLAGVVSIVAAYPGWLLLTRLGLLLLLTPLVPALLPRGRSATAVALLAVTGWLASTAATGGPVPLGRLLILAAGLYLLHSLAALAAVLPYDVVAPPGLVTRWLGRALSVVLGSSVLAVVTLMAAGRTGDRSLLAAALLGLCVAVAVCALLTWLWRRA